MQSLSSSFSHLVWTSEQMYSSMLPYCSFSARCTMWIWILLSPSLPSLLYYYCNYKWVEWSNNQMAGESQIYSDSQFLVLRMYSFFLASTGMASSFAIGDWTIGCLPNQLLLWRVSNSSSMFGTPAFLSNYFFTRDPHA